MFSITIDNEIKTKQNKNNVINNINGQDTRGMNVCQIMRFYHISIIITNT